MLRKEPLDDAPVLFRFERASRVDDPSSHLASRLASRLSSRLERGCGVFEQAKLFLRQVFEIARLQSPLDLRMPPQGSRSAARRIHQDSVKAFPEGKRQAAVQRNQRYTLLRGENLIQSYAAPILYSEPAYRSHFCSKCGSLVPPKEPSGDFLEIPAGLFDDDPGIQPDRHIFIEFIPSWDRITDDLPQFSIRDLVRQRRNRELPKDFKLRSHHDSENGDE